MRAAIVLRALMLVGAPGITCAGLNVIGDAGPSVPVAPYLGHLLSGRDQPGVLPGVRFPLSTQLQAVSAMVERDAPSTKPVLNPAWLVHPIFVLGTDDHSRQWLQRHRPVLIAQGATGVVVQAETERDFKSLQSVAMEVTLTPAVGPWLEQMLIAAEVKHYPIWIDTQGRVQASPTYPPKVIP